MPFATPTVLLGFFLPWAWGISSQLLQQSAAMLLTLDEGYLLTSALPDLQHGIAPLGPPTLMQPLLLGRNPIKKKKKSFENNSRIKDSSVNLMMPQFPILEHQLHWN